MKEHGLLLSAPMVRALPRKTQTRRVITMYNSVIERFAGRTKKETWNALDFTRARVDHDGRLWVPFKPGETTLALRIEVKPRIQAGDLIWWKETYGIYREHPEGVDYYTYRADPFHRHPNDSESSGRWRSSMLMPKKAARHTSMVVAVRPERLKEINAADAIAEGIDRPVGSLWTNYLMPTLACGSAEQSYMSLWESINGPGSWDANPLVWVVEFRSKEPDQT